MESIPADDGVTWSLTSAISRGDADAFGRFYEEWFHRAYRLARRLTRRDEAFCLDVVQDAMLRVVRSLRPMASRADLERWMARTIYTTAIDRMRREARRLRHEAAAGKVKRAGGEGSDVAAAAEIEEEIVWLCSELEKLSEQDRILIAERFGQGKTFRAAGDRVGLTAYAAYGRIRRLLERLRSAAREVFS